jgi:hypothetical protein
MMFHAPTGRYVIDSSKIKNAAHNLLYTLQKVRELGGLPLEPYAREGMLTPVCFAQMAVIEAAEDLGIDLGVTKHSFHLLDLRDKA